MDKGESDWVDAGYVHILERGAVTLTAHAGMTSATRAPHHRRRGQRTVGLGAPLTPPPLLGCLARLQAAQSWLPYQSRPPWCAARQAGASGRPLCCLMSRRCTLLDLERGATAWPTTPTTPTTTTTTTRCAADFSLLCPLSVSTRSGMMPARRGPSDRRIAHRFCRRPAVGGRGLWRARRAWSRGACAASGGADC